jgi:hypothetical protein
MNASGLRSFLNSQKKKIFNALPAGIFMEGILGFEDFTGIAEKFSIVESPVVQKRRPSKWVLPVLLGLIAIVVIWYFMNKQLEVNTTAATDTITAQKRRPG